MRPQTLVVDCDGARVQAIMRALGERFDCRQARTAQEIRQALANSNWAAVIASYDSRPDLSGLEVLQMASHAAPRAFRLLYCEACSPGLLADLRRLAHAHFHGDTRKPDFLASLSDALAGLLEPPSLELPAELPPIGEDAWVPRSPVGLEFLRELRAAAEQEAPVYLYGEAGVGRGSAAHKLRQWRREWRERGSPGGMIGSAPVAVLRVPSLRERPQDLPILAAQCLLENGGRTGSPERRLSPQAIAELLRRDWYGNVGELLRVVIAAAQRAGARTVIEAEDLPNHADPADRPSQCAKDEGQRECMLRQLRAARSVSAASRLERSTRANYIRLMRRLGIVRADVGMNGRRHEHETARSRTLERVKSTPELRLVNAGGN